MTLPLSLVLLIASAHWFADFDRQIEWMALEKSKWRWPMWRHWASWAPLTAHVVVYAGWMLAFVVAYATVVQLHERNYSSVVLWILVNGALHFCTDMWTSRWTGRLWFFEREVGIWTQAEYTAPKHGRTLVNPYSYVEKGRRMHYFFVVIGLDQLIHYVCLFTTAARWLT